MAILVISDPFYKDGKTRRRKHVQAKCLICDCVFEPRLSESRNLDSCGCGGRFKVKHGMAKTRVYKIHQGMIDRCTNPTSEKFHLYGGRGIKVCDRWKSFESFFIDMGEPDGNQSLDRINSDGDYEPINCRWATIVTQNNNKRTNKLLDIDGTVKTVAEWVRCHGSVNYTTVTGRLMRGWTAKQSVFGKS